MMRNLNLSGLKTRSKKETPLEKKKKIQNDDFALKMNQQILLLIRNIVQFACLETSDRVQEI